jgi:hypothetical protein
MKRTFVLFAAVLLVLVVAAPAAAAKPSVTYTVADANCSSDPFDREWVSGNMWHGRDSVAHFETFLLVGESWIPNGTLTVTGSLNANDRIFNAHAPLQIRDSPFGDFDGSFACSMGTCGSTLKGLDGALYDHLKLDVVGQSMVDVIVPDPPDVACGVAFEDDWFQIDTWTLH